MIQIFIRSTQNGIENIKRSFQEENWPEISETAHKMAAPCKHIMAQDLYNKIKQLEKYSIEPESVAKVSDLIDSIDSKIKKINKSLTSIINSDKFNL
jgi:HPt (histidine-containing phosphotransfer) domain-containing protein